MGYPAEINVSRVILERMKFDIKQELDDLDLKGIDFDINRYLNHVSARWIYEIKMNILGEKNKKEIKIPSSWWQMFKQQYLPESFLKRFPVQFNYIGLFEYSVLYPSLVVSLPKENHYVYVNNFQPWTGMKESIIKDYRGLLI